MAAAESALLPVVERRLIDPFRIWVCQTEVRGISPGDIPGPTDPLWRDPGCGAQYDNDFERGKRTTRDPQGMPADVGRLLVWLRSEAMVRLWEEVTGIAKLSDDPTLHGGGLHVLAGGGWLNTHLDYARHPVLEGYERRVNLILFLNPEWRQEWGGAFEMCRPDGSVAERVHPAPGRLVAFEPSDVSYHATQRIVLGAGPGDVGCVYLAPPALGDASPGPVPAEPRAAVRCKLCTPPTSPSFRSSCRRIWANGCVAERVGHSNQTEYKSVSLPPAVFDGTPIERVGGMSWRLRLVQPVPRT